MPLALILGGTAEAAQLADRLAGRDGWTVVTSLAGSTRHPAPLAGAVRRGGFGGIDGLAAWLRDRAPDVLVDATHPFAAQISAHAAAAAATTATPMVRIDRPRWHPQDGDRWIAVGDVAAAAAAVPPGARVFLPIGRRDLDAFAAADAFFLVRMIDPPTGPVPLARHVLTLGRGPFRTEGEVALLRHHRIGWLVSKNSGGAGAYPKIAAARLLGLTVLMIDRPGLPAGETVADVDGALAWLLSRFGRMAASGGIVAPKEAAP